MKTLIYGAYGYTGTLISELAAKEPALQPLTLAGRDADKTKALADRLGLAWEAFPLDNPEALDKALAGVGLVLNIAGPYSQTAKPMAKACMRNGIHYVDVTGEMAVFEWMAHQDTTAKEAGIVLLPGAGFDVVPTDCLAAWLHGQLPSATHLELAFKGAGSLSRGTALTMAENLHKGGAIRKDGKIVPVPPAWKTRSVPFGGKVSTAVSIPWGDVSTAYYTTGIPNIVTYMGIGRKAAKRMKLMRYIKWAFAIPFVQGLMKNRIRKKVSGPSEEIRTNTESFIWGEVRNAGGESKQAGLRTPEGYRLTSLTAVLIAKKVAEGTLAPGFYTPAKAFGHSLILEIPETELTPLG